MRQRQHALPLGLGLAVLAATAATAQVKEVPKDSPTSSRAPASEPGDRRPDISRPGGDAREALEKRGVKPSETDAQVIRKIALEQSKYRKRLAQVKRLRELAEADGNQQRLARLDELEAKINRLHEQKVAGWQQRLGKDKFDRVNRELEHRRKDRKARGKAADPGDDGKQPVARGVDKPPQRVKRKGESRGTGREQEPPSRGGPADDGAKESAPKNADRRDDRAKGKGKGRKKGDSP